jgi:FkbM family methyltransferase
MALTFHKELSKLNRAKSIMSLCPKRARFRVAKALYDYQSDDIHGIDLVAPLQGDGLVCFLNTKDLIGWKIFFFGEYEADTNRVVIEAGANMGSETLLISRLACKGHVYGFEPNPYVFERLKINVSINELKNVDVFDIALGETDRTVNFNIYPKNFCNSGMSSKYMETSQTRKIDVPQQTLDSFINERNIGKVDFIKMDIQGAEMDMIVGAHETILKYKPTIFTEACRPYNDTDTLYAKLSGYGYEVCLIGDKETIPMKSASEVKDGNWLAINRN